MKIAGNQFLSNSLKAFNASELINQPPRLNNDAKPNRIRKVSDADIIGVFPGTDQTTDAQPAFDVAVIKPNKSGQYIPGDHLQPGGRFVFSDATAKELIMWAWKVRIEYVVGGPPWIDRDRFNIIAKAPPETTLANARMMLRTLLADRFRLLVRQEEKVVPVFALVVDKGGPTLTPAAETAHPHCGRAGASAPTVRFTFSARGCR